MATLIHGGPGYLYDPGGETDAFGYYDPAHDWEPGILTAEDGWTVWEVPSGVTVVRAHVFGASEWGKSGYPAVARGGGIAADITVTPGDVLGLLVGGHGGQPHLDGVEDDGTRRNQSAVQAINGRSGRGGTANSFLAGTTDLAICSAGGSASAIWNLGPTIDTTIASDLSQRILVAGGAGGSSYIISGGSAVRHRAGGHGSGGNGQAGEADTTVTGGAGGTTSTGGAAGSGATGPNRDGVFGDGGNAGGGGFIGGGGGGGWYGGGAGGRLDADLGGGLGTETVELAGGGGGSGHADPTMCSNVVTWTGVRQGIGLIVLEWVPDGGDLGPFLGIRTS